jgi:histidyl-tRNA synthetase
MIRIKDTQYHNTAAFLSSAVQIAEYYGFIPVEEALSAAQQAPRTKKTSSTAAKVSFAFIRKDERTLLPLVRRFATFAPQGIQPFLAWRTVAGTGAIPVVTFELHVVGASNPIAEAMLMVVTDAIAAEAGITQRFLSLNNVGTSESNGRFTRDVGTFLRKHLETITPSLRPRVASDPLGTLMQLIERGHPIVPRAPQSMEYLTEEERRRFWDLLEYVEMSGLTYELSPHVLGSRDFWSQSLFEVLAQDPESTGRIRIAFGGRYDPIASRFARRPLPAVMMSIACEVLGSVDISHPSPYAPRIYFAQLGPEARRRALPTIELLRKAGIPIHQRIYHESIGEQMAYATKMSTPYLIIMGHKEVIEDSVLVRDVSSNSQHTVPVGDLVSYLKRRKIGTIQAKEASARSMTRSIAH